MTRYLVVLATLMCAQPALAQSTLNVTGDATVTVVPDRVRLFLGYLFRGCLFQACLFRGCLFQLCRNCPFCRRTFRGYPFSVRPFRGYPFQSCPFRGCPFSVRPFRLRRNRLFRRRAFRGQLPGPSQEPRGQVLAGLGHDGAAELLEVLALALLPGTAFGARLHMIVAAGGPLPGSADPGTAGPAPEPAARASQ